MGVYNIDGHDLIDMRAVLHFLPYGADGRSLTLCGIRHAYDDEKIPFAEEYIFHKLGGSDYKLYSGRTFNDIQVIGEVPFDPNLYVYGVSPKDGRIICGKREDKGLLYVYDRTNTTALFSSASRKPYGWLYTSGIEFIRDGDTEYCVFAEYAHTPSQDGLYVWRGKYPYTSEEDWQTVFYQQLSTNDETVGSIRHFHLVRRDPWTNVLYLASGDNPNQINWWYSTDYGEGWKLLFNNTNVGWEEHVGRCCNIVFTAEAAYWASDRDINHCLNSIERDSTTGVLNPSTRKRLCSLPEGQATNSVCLCEYPHGIFMFDRIDAYSEGRAHWNDPEITLTFYSLDKNELKQVGKVKKASGWGGHRGKCYTNYTSGQEVRPAMGFSSDTPCIFSFVGASDKIGTVFYEII